MTTTYRERRYNCGEYLDVYLFPVFSQVTRGGKRTKRRPSTEAQKKLNRRHRREKAVRLLHANFTPDDLEIHLTYRVKPESVEAAEKHLTNWLRRVRRYVKKNGLGELKYFAVTEQGSRGGRIHHHITISGIIERDTLEKMWQHGYANSRRLQFTEEGLVGLGTYITKSPAGKKAWRASKNLIDPPPKQRDGRLSAKKVRELADDLQNSAKFEALYPGYLMSQPAEAWHNDVNGGCYLVARFYRADGKFIKPQRRRKGGNKPHGH